tara:strand:+ start:1329 stop:1676 length:348 start_codon:yes stop_codon:yes gene_type:complete
MKKLTTSTSSQTLKIIPRTYASSVTLSVRDDSANTSVSYTVTPTKTGDYMVLDQAFALKEGRYYDLEVKEGSDVIYKDKIFCTDQTVQQSTNNYYTINSGTYTTDTTYDNELILL